MFGLSESSIDPGKEFLVKWDGRGSSTARLLEHFAVLDEKVRVAADFADGSPAAYEHPNGKEKAILSATLTGQFNEQKPVVIHPLRRNPGEVGRSARARVDDAVEKLTLDDFLIARRSGLTLAMA